MTPFQIDPFQIDPFQIDPFQIDHMNLTRPTAKEVTSLRRALQQHFCIKDAHAAKKLCADIAAVTPNLWRRWEQNASPGIGAGVATDQAQS
jgi:hypothetical protein